MNENEKTIRTTDDFINDLTDGSIIAVQTGADTAVSVVVMSHARDINNKVVGCIGKDRKGVYYEVPRASIIWHKVNRRYPAWIYRKIKNGENIGGESYAKKSENMEQP